MIVDADTLGRMAIRAGRAYSQAWARDIPRSVPWNWDMAKYYVGISAAKRLPEFDESRVAITYDHSSTHWLLSQERIEMNMYDRNAQAYVGYVRCEVDALGAPVISVRLESPRRMVDGSIWRVDKALTSLSCERWQPLYQLPPLSVVLELLGPKAVPSCPITMFYRVSANGPTIDVAGTPIGDEQKASYAVFDSAFRRLIDNGMCAKWAHARVAKAVEL